MPIDIKTEATTRSMIRNGRNSRKPISKARLSSEIMKAGTSTRSDRSSGLAGAASFDMSTNNFKSFSRTFFSMKARSGCEPRWKACSAVIWLATSGCTPVSYAFCSAGPMTKAVRNSDSETMTELGGAERGAQERQHHDDAGERGHHDEDRGRQRQHRQQRDHLDHALGETPALREVDADLLRAGGRRQRDDQSGYPGR